MNKNGQTNLFITFIFYSLSVYSQQEIEIVMVPQPYEKALKNPLMGFTTTNLGDHPWASVTHTYIRWNELENNESDGIDKIVNVSNQKWKNAASKNMKVIPRVYLHWDGDKNTGRRICRQMITQVHSFRKGFFD